AGYLDVAAACRPHGRRAPVGKGDRCRRWERSHHRAAGPLRGATRHRGDLEGQFVLSRSAASHLCRPGAIRAFLAMQASIDSICWARSRSPLLRFANAERTKAVISALRPASHALVKMPVKGDRPLTIESRG